MRLQLFAGLGYLMVAALAICGVAGTPLQTPQRILIVYLGVVLACLLLALSAIPFVLLMAESLLWLAVWIVHRPTVRRWLRRGRRR